MLHFDGHFHTPKTETSRYDLLKDNQLTNFDPVKEAFKVYDPNDTGFVDMEVLASGFSRINISI